MRTIEVTNEGETLKINVTDSTTASDVCEIVNAKWPGTACLIPSQTSNSLQKKLFQNEMRARYQEQKADRIAQNAEAAQRLAKGRQWK